MSSRPPTSSKTDAANAAQEKLYQLLQDQTSWIGEVGKSIERSEDHIKQRIQYFDRLGVLSGAILAFSVPAFTSLQAPGRTITHRYSSLGFAIGGWAFLFLATIGSAVTHYLLVEFYTSEHEKSVQSVLFNNLNLLQKNLMRAAGGNLDDLQPVSVPILSFKRLPWHEKLGYRLALSSRVALVACLLGASSIFFFLILSSF
jgi:hypothetical protein